MNNSLTDPVSTLELKVALTEMAKERSLPDGLLVEFYMTLWDIIGEEYIMIHLAIQ